MRRYLVIFGILMVSTPAWSAPSIMEVTLKPHTTFTVYIVPDLGTRFVFPFVLDEGDEYVPFTLNITNESFQHDRKEGRNSFVVTIPPPKDGSRPPIQYSNLFVTVAGYEISVELRSTTDLTKHKSDIVFKLSPEKREELIQHAVAQRTKALEREYKERSDALDKQVDKRALSKVGALALTSPTSVRIKEEGQLTLDNGDKVTVFLDNALTYGPYTLFLFNIDNRGYTAPIDILDAKLFAVDSNTKQSTPIDGAPDIPPRVLPRTEGKGVVTVMKAQLPTDDKALQLQLLTNKGAVQLQW